MEKKTFVTLEQVKEMAAPIPSDFKISMMYGFGVAFTAKYSWKFGFHANAAFSFLAFSRIPFSSYR